MVHRPMTRRAHECICKVLEGHPEAHSDSEAPVSEATVSEDDFTVAWQEENLGCGGASPTRRGLPKR